MKNKKTLIAIIGLVVLIVASYGLYYIMSKNYNGNQSDPNLVQNNQTEDLNLMNSDSPNNQSNADDNNGVVSDSELGVLIGSSETIAAGTGQAGTPNPASINQNQPQAGQSGDSASPQQSATEPVAQNNNVNSNPPAADTTGTPATDFTVYDANGNAVSLSSLFGRPIVLNFWASWCSPCKSEMPHFQSAYESFGSKVQFVMVNLTDGQKETQSSANKYINSQGYTFPVYYDTSQSAVNAYSVYNIPQTYFISASGRVITKTYGSITQSTLQNNINSLINR